MPYPVTLVTGKILQSKSCSGFSACFLLYIDSDNVWHFNYISYLHLIYLFEKAAIALFRQNRG